MGQEVELSALDLRYESYRMKNPGLEGRLLASIARRGIEEPLEGVDRNIGEMNAVFCPWSNPNPMGFPNRCK